MERKILFRGQTRKYGEEVHVPTGEKMPGLWVYGGVLQGEGDYSIIYGYNNPEQTGEIQKYMVYTDTLGQFTGLLDKDNNKIFEGDILLFGDEPVVVYWNGERFSWMAKKAVEYPYRKFPDNKDWDYIDLGWIATEVPCLGKMTTQIIGNIHNNAESFIIEHDENMTWEDF